jgi:hypothetical protein
MALGDNTAAMTLAESAIAMMSGEKDALTGPRPLDILACVAARAGDADRAISTLEKLLSIPYEAPLLQTHRSRRRYCDGIRCLNRCARDQRVQKLVDSGK